MTFATAPQLPAPILWVITFFLAAFLLLIAGVLAMDIRKGWILTTRGVTTTALHAEVLIAETNQMERYLTYQAQGTPIRLVLDYKDAQGPGTPEEIVYDPHSPTTLKRASETWVGFQHLILLFFLLGVPFLAWSAWDFEAAVQVLDRPATLWVFFLLMGGTAFLAAGQGGSWQQALMSLAFVGLICGLIAYSRNQQLRAVAGAMGHVASRGYLEVAYTDLPAVMTTSPLLSYYWRHTTDRRKAYRMGDGYLLLLDYNGPGERAARWQRSSSYVRTVALQPIKSPPFAVGIIAAPNSMLVLEAWQTFGRFSELPIHGVEDDVEWWAKTNPAKLPGPTWAYALAAFPDEQSPPYVEIRDGWLIVYLDSPSKERFEILEKRPFPGT